MVLLQSDPLVNCSHLLPVKLPGYRKAEEAVCSAWMYLQVTVDESIDLRHALMIDSSQNNYEENHHKSWKSPTQKKKQQIPPFCVFIIHHQHVPEIHRLRKEAEHKMNRFWSSGTGNTLTWLRHKE